MTKTIANHIDAITNHEAQIEKNLVLNYDKVYSPLFKMLKARHDHFETIKGTPKVNDQKKAYDIEQGLRDDKGDYLKWSLSQLSQFTGFALISKKEFVALCDEFGGNTLQTLYKNQYSAKRAEQSKKSKSKGDTPAKKGAKTREANLQAQAIEELTDGFEINKLAYQISQSENYGAMGIGDIKNLADKIISAMLKDNGISSAKKEAYDNLKKTG